MSRSTLAGASALLAAPVLVIVGTLIQPTLAEEAAEQAAAIAAHRGAVIAGLALSTLAGVLLTAGVVWLALAVAPWARNLATAGGILGVLGMLVVLYEDGVSAAGPSVVAGLDPAQATATLDRIGSSAAVSTLEPVSILGAVGLALIAVAVARAGVSRVAAVALGVGPFVETAGFATGTKALVVVGFALQLVGFAPAVRTLVGTPHRRAAAGAVAAL